MKLVQSGVSGEISGDFSSELFAPSKDCITVPYSPALMEYCSAALGWTDNLLVDSVYVQRSRTNTQAPPSASKLTVIANKRGDSISKWEPWDLDSAG